SDGEPLVLAAGEDENDRSDARVGKRQEGVDVRVPRTVRWKAVGRHVDVRRCPAWIFGETADSRSKRGFGVGRAIYKDEPTQAEPEVSVDAQEAPGGGEFPRHLVADGVPDRICIADEPAIDPVHRSEGKNEGLLDLIRLMPPRPVVARERGW